MDINPENVLSMQHKEWLNHPVTQQMLQNLDIRRNLFIKSLSSKSSEVETPDATFRLWAYGIQTVDSIKNLVTNTQLFIETNKNK